MNKKMRQHPKHLGEEKISKLLMKQSVPAIIGMIVMALYNLVDTIYIGRGVGTDGIAAASVVFPVQMIVGAFAMAFGIGAASIISRRLGEGKSGEVSKIFGNFQVMNLFVAIVFSVLGIAFAEPLLKVFGATGEIMDLSKIYFSILMLGTTFLCFNMGNNNIIRSVGHAKMAMIVMLVSAILNTVIDPILIFGFKMGIAGAAWSSVISWIIASMIVLSYYFSKQNIFHIKISDFKPDFHRMKEIFLIGLPSLARQIATSGIVIVINNYLAIYGGSLAIAAYGVVNRALMVFFMPMFGIVQGMQPILGYNHGAGLKVRVKEVTILSIKILTVFSVVVSALSLLFPSFITGLFTQDQELISMAARAMRTVVLLFSLIGFQVVASGFYQALGKVKPAFVLGLLRQIIVFLPILIVFAKIWGLEGIWFAFPASDAVAVVITYFIFSRDLRKIHSE